MKGASDAASLCTECGLCCDGTLFADVELKGEAEAASVEAMGLEVDEEDGRELLIQPCRALDGTRCTIYPHRPECCRTFECGVLMRLRKGQITPADAMARVNEVKQRAYAGDIVGACCLIDRHFLKPPA
jgi:hypothetical protein